METNYIGNKDPYLLTLAKKVDFKSYVFFYFIENTFFWMIWWTTVPAESKTDHTPWPVWAMLGWGIVLIIHFVLTYILRNDEQGSIEKEYKKLLKEVD